MPKPFRTSRATAAHPHLALEGWRGMSSPTITTTTASDCRRWRISYSGGLMTHAAPPPRSPRRPSIRTSGSSGSITRVRRGRPAVSRTATTTAPDGANSGPGTDRDRLLDASCNAYLAAAAVIAAGLDGIENGLDAGEPNSENLYDFSLRRAHRAAGSRSLPGEPARGDRRARARRRPARGARPRPRRGLRRLLRAGEAATSGSATTSRSRAWEIREYLTRF